MRGGAVGTAPLRATLSSLAPPSFMSSLSAGPRGLFPAFQWIGAAACDNSPAIGGELCAPRQVQLQLTATDKKSVAITKS